MFQYVVQSGDIKIKPDAGENAPLTIYKKKTQLEKQREGIKHITEN